MLRQSGRVVYLVSQSTHAAIPTKQNRAGSLLLTYTTLSLTSSSGLAVDVGRHWKVSWSPPILRAMSVVCWILTVGCLWSEILLSSPVPLSPFGALVSLVGASLIDCRLPHSPTAVWLRAGLVQVAIATIHAPMPACLRSCAGESSPFVVEAATFLPLLYLSICTYRSLFKFKLFGDFSLKVGSSQHRHPLSPSDLPTPPTRQYHPRS